MDKSTLIRHLGSLEKAGLIRRDSRRRENGSQTSTAYLLHLAPAPKETGCRNSQQSPVADCNTPCGKTQQGPVAKCDPHNLGNEEDDDDDDGDRDATAPLTDLQGTAPAKPQKPKSPSKIVGGLYDGCRSLDQEFERVWA